MVAGPVKVSIFSDYVCPFCYLGVPAAERLRKEFGERVEVEWKAFELRPEPAPLLDPRGEYLTRVWSQAVYPMAEARGMTLQLPPVQPRSRKALEAAEFAREQGKFDEFHLACFRAFFEEGRDIGDPEVLLALGEEVGLARDALQQALATDQYTPKVLADQAEAARLGITGVPTYIVGERHVVVGAQPYEVLREVTDRALHERQ